MSGEKDGEFDSTYLLQFPERRRHERKQPNGEVKDPASLRSVPRKKPTGEMHARVWTVVDAACQILDLSQDGVRIRTQVSLSKGEEVGLHLLVPESVGGKFNQVSISPTCLVVWSQSENNDARAPYQMGLKIVQMTERQTTTWQSFVATLPVLN